MSLHDRLVQARKHLLRINEEVSALRTHNRNERANARAQRKLRAAEEAFTVAYEVWVAAGRPDDPNGPEGT